MNKRSLGEMESAGSFFSYVKSIQKQKQLILMQSENLKQI